MSVDQTTRTARNTPRPPTDRDPRSGQRFWQRRRDRPPRRVRKLRVFLILAGFGTLAVISIVFGMLTAVASDLPELNVTAKQDANVDSFLYDDTGQAIGVLAPPGGSVIDTWHEISPLMDRAIISVEDKRFWTDPGIDLKGLLRATVSDVTGGPREGASTIAEQFVKVREEQEDHRTILEKLREAALAFQLVHKWHRKDILTEYLNSIYFGNGATGIESAARVYFGNTLGYEPDDPGEGGCGDATAQNPKIPKCAKLLTYYQAALLAGMVANPTAFDPVLHRQAALQRRRLVLRDMLAQHYITRRQYEIGKSAPLPTAHSIQQPAEPAAAPYFTAWVRPQIVRALQQEGLSPSRAQYDAYYGGLKIRLTINLKMQQAAQTAVDEEFPPGSGPTASLVAIDNQTGEVRAMVSGDGDYDQSPFNLAVDGERQPGSSFKLFTLATALTTGAYGPYSVIDSEPLDISFRGPGGVPGHFIVHNFGNVYSGPVTLAEATAQSDNSVFAQVGTNPAVGTLRIAKMAKAMGIRTSISTNPSMILGGLKVGVSALDMAHAYETVATGGLKVWNKTLGDVNYGPIGIHSIDDCGACLTKDIVNKPQYTRVISPEVAATIHELLQGVVESGTGTEAAIPGVDVAGKTGTTSNYVDAWFVGWTPQMTVAVWVGYPNSAVPMLTNWEGSPVEGGTYPAVIWRNFMESALQIIADQSAGKPVTAATGESVTGAGTAPSTTTTTTATTTTTTTPTTATTPTTPTGGTGAGAGATTTPAATPGATAGATTPGADGTGAGTPGTTGATGATGGTAGGTTGGTTGPSATGGSSSTGGAGLAGG